MSVNTAINATYRLQLSRDFTFSDAVGICGYLQMLGISHLYLSPVFESAPGSAHGYDMTDFTRISEERGGEEGLRALDKKLRSMNPPMGMILDFVPNHMAASAENPFWADVLRKGRDSQWWNLFDFRLEEGEKLPLPVLGSSLEEAVGSGMLKTGTRAGNTVLCYGDRWFPVRDGSADPNEQHYELVYWKEVFKRAPYRRFFDITDLVCLRMEDPAVFDAVHEKLFSLMRELPSITGIRVDHVDGLHDPAAYLERLSGRAPRIWVEKILARGEKLPDWPVCGTTGYEFIDLVNLLVVNREGFGTLERFWNSAVNPRWKGFAQSVRSAKEQVLNDLFPAELKRLAAGGKSRNSWVEETVALPVYRTYETGNEAVQEWQKLSAPAMAKGLEDTAHYRYTPLLALNEVGCEAALEPPDFFRRLQERGVQWPEAMNATSTHDTKRAEDTRARFYALADHAEEWIAFYQGLPAGPLDPQTAWFLFQTLAAVWPVGDVPGADFVDRISAYMEKAMREAKCDTNWLAPNAVYEEQLKGQIRQLLDSGSFRRKMDGFVNKIAWEGCRYSLSVLTLKTLAPGIPDFYQGSELWDFSLVDPDNRRPVDFRARKALLRGLVLLEEQEGRNALLARLVENWTDGAIKFWLTKTLLTLRHELLHGGENLAISEVSCRDHTVYMIGRKGQLDGLLVSIPVKPTWQERRKPAPEVVVSHDMITGKNLTMEDVQNPDRLFEHFPVSVAAAMYKVR